MEIDTTVRKLDGAEIVLEELYQDYDTWVHTGRKISVTKCPPNSLVAKRKLGSSDVYGISGYVRGRAVLIANAKYHTLQVLKDLFVQMNYVVSIHILTTADEVVDAIAAKARLEDNALMDSFVVVIDGTPKGFDFRKVPPVLSHEQAPNLRDKPKLIYAIGDDTVVQHVIDISRTSGVNDLLLAATGFNVAMIFIYLVNKFAHEVHCQEIMRLMLQFARKCRYSASGHSSMTKEFFFFPGLTSSVIPEELQQNLSAAELKLYLDMLKHGEVETYNIRLMFVGLYGAGKTCTARRIMGRDITDVNSTDGIDVYIGKCKVDLDTQQWTTVDDQLDEMPYQKLADHLLIDPISRDNIPNIKKLEEQHEKNMSQLNPSSSGHTCCYQQSAVMERQAAAPMCTVVNSSPRPPDRQVKDTVALDATVRMCPPPSEPIDDSMDTTESESSTQDNPGPSTMDAMEMTDSNIPTPEGHRLKYAKQVVEKSRQATGSVKAEARVSLWDFAGQFVYYATHQLFFSPRCVYLLVLNMKDQLDTPIKNWYTDIQGKHNIDLQGAVNFWLHSIYTYAQGPLSGIPPVFLVGTHRDQLDEVSEDDKRNVARKYFNKVRTLFEGSPISRMLSPKTFLLDNNDGSDPEVLELKDAITSVAKALPYWGERMPARWVELEQALEDKRRHDRVIISMTELNTINQALTMPIESDRQLQVFLKAHHEMGNIVYFGGTAGLEDTIVLKPQWIALAFSYLICADDFIGKYGELRRQWHDFNRTGRLEVQLAENIWKQDSENRFFENRQVLLLLLERLDIISHASIINEDGHTTRPLSFYFVPCLLTEKPDKQLFASQQTKECISTPVLCLKFQHDFLPPSLFNRTLAMCLAKWPVARRGKKPLLYCGCGVFEVSHLKGEDKHRLVLFCINGAIGVRILRYSAKGAHQVDQTVCDRVRRSIVSTVRKEFMRFNHGQSSDPDDGALFTYQLQCRRTVEDEVLEEGLHTVSDLLEVIGSDFFCQEHSNMIEPHSADIVDLLQEWFPDKIPECHRRKQESTLDTRLEKLPERVELEPVSDKVLTKLPNALGSNWQLLMTEQLGLKKVEVDRTMEDYPRRTVEQIFHCLAQWKQRMCREGKVPTCKMMLDALRACRTVSVDWELVRDAFDDVYGP